MSRNIFPPKAERSAAVVEKSTSSPTLMGGLRFTAKHGHCQYGKLSQVNLDQKKSVAVKETRNFVNRSNLLAVVKLNYDRGTSTPVPRVLYLCRRRTI